MRCTFPPFYKLRLLQRWHGQQAMPSLFVTSYNKGGSHQKEAKAQYPTIPDSVHLRFDGYHLTYDQAITKITIFLYLPFFSKGASPSSFWRIGGYSIAQPWSTLPLCNVRLF